MSETHDAVHDPVQPDAVLEHLAPREGDLTLDGTLGAAGHAARILGATSTGRLIGIDRDPEILAIAAARLASFGSRVELHAASYERFQSFLPSGAAPLSGALLDLGLSSLQIDRPDRGFSYQEDGPLDMRMDPTSRRTAADLLNRAPAADLFRVIREHGDEPAAKRIVDAIVAARARAPLRRTCELRDLVAHALRRNTGDALTRSLARVFMAIRIAVNDEIAELERTIPRLVARLAPGGRLVVISFHGGEDRIVKQCFHAAVAAGLARALTERPIEPSATEVARNPRARSSKLRAIERSAADPVVESRSRESSARSVSGRWGGRDPRSGENTRRSP